MVNIYVGWPAAVPWLRPRPCGRRGLIAGRAGAAGGWSWSAGDPPRPV